MSARAEFLATLRAGLRDAPAQQVDDVITDYTAHFAEGSAAGRGEAEIAAALGHPLALADQLRAELRIEKWQAAPSVRSGFQVFAAAVALGVFNSALMLVAAPVLLLLALLTIIAIAALAGSGLWMLLAGASLHLPGGTAVSLLGGLGLLTAGIALTALASLAARLFVNALGHYIRLHHRLLPGRLRAGLPP